MKRQFTLLIIPCSVLLRMRNISNKICREKQNTHFKLHNFFFFENRAVCVIMWKNIVEPDRPQMTIWRMRFACWIPKATNTHSGYVILIAFPLQRWLHEHASMLRYTCIACLLYSLKDECLLRGSKLRFKYSQVIVGI